MICKHENIEMIGHDYYLDDEQNMVEETKFVCLDCGSEGHQLTIQKPLKWFYDPDQTKLPIQP
tara:strand:- start:25 stop:213 length:189 start_codon:yes stop_codon:yes gene_type:complete